MFEFGKNWNNYSKKIRSKNIHISIDDLKYYLGIKLKNKKFLDIGCGSGLSSLAACKLGARVTSFDVDNLSTATTIALKKNREISSNYGNYTHTPLSFNEMLEREPINRALKNSEISAFKHFGFWKCMDTLRDKNELENILIKGDAPWLKD